ncbi:SEL1-like repeat protein [Pseudomonas sp. EL_65y_Pfl2_R96]|uniref:SEL1-like repeat protein n=1 Tax=Pseudomonas sp. EL_65y_Pfl2_R96 TaxID=3088699 RepID=UPI0030DAA43A
MFAPTLIRSSTSISYLRTLRTAPFAIRQSLIEDINEALLSLAALKGWDNDPIHRLQAEIIKRDYRFSGTSGRSLKNPSKTLKATVAWRTDQYIKIGVLVQGSKNTPEAFFTATRISVARGLFESLLGPVEWVNDQTVRLFQVNKRDYWEIDTTSKTVEFHFARAESGDAHGQYDMAKMYLDGWIVEQDFERARRWRPPIRLLEGIQEWRGSGSYRSQAC